MLQILRKAAAKSVILGCKNLKKSHEILEGLITLFRAAKAALTISIVKRALMVTLTI